MPRLLKGKILEDYDANINDCSYKKGQIINVTELEYFNNDYAVYYNSLGYSTLDWIPKKIVQII